MKLFRNMRFRSKMILICILMLLVNSGIAGSVYYNYAFKDTLENYYSSSEDMVAQMKMHIVNEAQSITRRVHAVYGNYTFYNQMSQYFQSQDSKQYVKLLGSASDIITEICQGDRYIHSVSIETELGSFENYTRIRNHEFDFMKSDMKKYFDENPNATFSYFPARKSPIFRGNEIVIPVVYKFHIARQDVFVVVSLLQSELREYIRDIYNSYDEIFIADQNGNEVLEFGDKEKEILDVFTNEEMEEKNAVCRQVEVERKTYLATCAQIKETGWTICAIRSTKSLLENLENLRYFIIGIICLCAIISIIFIVVIVHKMTAPLGKLATIMNEVTKKEEFQNRFEYPYQDEIGTLGISFNYMAEKITGLIAELNSKIDELKEEKETVKRIQIQKRKAELRALQAQINPHFLYNTLNAITWQAAESGARDVSVLSNSLGKFFRISLSKGREIITVREELDHVENYLRIQQIRYKNTIQYEIKAEEDLMDMYVIKLVLQPLVENAIYHGIKLKQDSGMISIRVSRWNNKEGIPAIQMVVEDDGEGIEKTKLELIQENLKKGCIYYDDGYGIYNVNERIKLYYDDEYGLAIDSVYKEWTRSTITIPVRTTDGA